MNRVLLTAGRLVALVIVMGMASIASAAVPTVAVVQVIEHPALEATRRGIHDELQAQGFEHPATMTWLYDNVQGSAVMAAQVAQKLKARKPDVVVAIGTPAAQALRKVLKGIPIVFSSVTDPQGAGLVRDMQHPEGSITGVSNFMPCDAHLRAYQELLPTLKRLAVIYNPGESNAARALADVQRAAVALGITVVPVQAERTSAVPPAAQAVVGKVDAVLIHNDNTALAAIAAVAKIANRAKVPVFASDTDVIGAGALAAFGPDQYQLGRQTGDMVAQILHGKSVASLPVGTPQNAVFVIDTRVAQRLGLPLPHFSGIEPKLIGR